MENGKLKTENGPRISEHGKLENPKLRLSIFYDQNLNT